MSCSDTSVVASEPEKIKVVVMVERFRVSEASRRFFSGFVVVAVECELSLPLEVPAIAFIHVKGKQLTRQDLKPKTTDNIYLTHGDIYQQLRKFLGSDVQCLVNARMVVLTWQACCSML